MLSRLYDDHYKRVRPARREENVHLREDALEKAKIVNSDLVDGLNSGVSAVFQNQRKIEMECRTLKQQSERFSKQTKQWLELVDSFTKSLKELGDVESWAQSIEWDMRQVVSALQQLQLSTIRPVKPPKQPKE